MKPLMSAFVAGAAVILSSAASYATPITFVANLSPANEVPPTASFGTGFASVTLDTDPAVHTMAVDVSFSNLTTGTTAAHIHCCLASPFLTGVNVMVAQRLRIPDREEMVVRHGRGMGNFSYPGPTSAQLLRRVVGVADKRCQLLHPQR